MTATLNLDHPGWLTGPSGHPVRLVMDADVPWIAEWQPAAGPVLRPVGTDDATAPGITYTAPGDLPPTAGAAPLVRRLVTLGPVQRLTNPSLWDAITTAILRQVVRADQARTLYRRWCGLGPTVEAPVGPLSLVPDPATVLDLSDDAFAQIGAKFHRNKLRAAATAYLAEGSAWELLTPEDLVKALHGIEGIGPWTAGAAAADYTGDFSVYPHGDLAVRTWARRVLPGMPLPDKDHAFAGKWRELAGHNGKDLHALTLYTLTWGTHVRSAQHEGTADRP